MLCILQHFSHKATVDKKKHNVEKEEVTAHLIFTSGFWIKKERNNYWSKLEGGAIEHGGSLLQVASNVICVPPF